MSNLIKSVPGLFGSFLLGSALAILGGCQNQATDQISDEISGIQDLTEQEAGIPYQPFPLSVSAIGQVEAAPDIAVVTGLIEIEDKSHDAVYAQIADIINGVQTVADTAETQMSYTEIKSYDQRDEDCDKDNQTAASRFYNIRSALGHNRSVNGQIKAIENSLETQKTEHEAEVKKEKSTLRKLNRNRDIPEFRREIFDLEEEIEELEEDYAENREQTIDTIAKLRKSIKEIEPRLAFKLCGVTSVKGQLSFTARINPAEKAPEFMNAFTRAGASKVNLFGYDFSDYDMVYQQAAERAVKNAREKAQLIAERSGTTLKGVKAFSVSQPTRFGRFGPQSKAIVSQPRFVNKVSVPPVFETYSETIVVQEASTQLVTVPPTYETVSETVVVQEASTELVTVPATFETVTETIVIQPAYEYNGQTVPAVTEQFQRRVMKTPAQTQERVIPAVSKQQTRRVIKTPAATTERVIPAVTKQITRRRIKTPARTIEQEAPAIAGQTSAAQNNALKSSLLSGPQTIKVSAYMVFDYHTALDDVRIIAAVQSP